MKYPRRVWIFRYEREDEGLIIAVVARTEQAARAEAEDEIGRYARPVLDLVREFPLKEGSQVVYHNTLDFLGRGSA